MIWAWDIEAVEWDRPVCVVAISEAGDVVRYDGPGCLAAFVGHAERAGGTFVAHAGGIYDTLLYSQHRGRPWSDVIMSGSAVLAAREGRRLTLRDSFRWWLSSLGKVGAYLDTKEQARETPRHAAGYWRKKDVDRSRIDALTSTERLDYCQHDCAILLEGIRAAREYLAERGARPAWTAGACAIELMKQIEPQSWRALARHALTARTVIAASECVRGARVECWARGHVPRVYVYDYKSAYPASYCYQPVGIGAVRLDPSSERDHDRRGSVWRCRWFWSHRDRIPPALDAMTGAGAGWCEAWLVPEERDLFDRAEVSLTYLEGWAPTTIAPIGQRFARELYAEKERGSFFGKVYLNSWHGKASESPIKTAWTRERPAVWYGGGAPEAIGDYWRWLDLDAAGDDVDTALCRPHVQPLSGAHILGRQRATLTAAIWDVVEAGGEVYYCDTDSIHTDLSPERMPMALGSGMGELALEAGPLEGWYVGPKAYALRDLATGAIKGACKGMPWGALRDGVVKTSHASGGATYRGARGDELGSDLRVEAFERALADAGGVQIVKEGITSWATGARRTHGWAREELPRTLRPETRGKAWSPGGSATAWAYRSPAEVIRRAPFLPLSVDDRGLF